MDEERFPTMCAYLDRLPQGIDSYEACKAKGSLVRQMLLDHRLGNVRGSVPDAVADLVEDPPPAAVWLPQVHARAVLRAVYDESFGGSLSRLAHWAYVSQKRLFSGPLYKILFWGLSPERLMKLASNRYGHFHIGVDLELADEGKRKIITLRYPMGVIDELDHVTTVEGIRAALELAGAQSVASEVLDTASTRARIAFTWQ